jgi:hypothetical protein
MNQAIEWNQAQQVSQQVTEVKTDTQQAKITEFLESNCELFDAQDLEYYQNETGKSLDWLLENGKNIDPTLSMALSMGITLDEAQMMF